MHPVFTQVPPNLWRSMMATVLPAAENRAARDGLAWPVPMMMASKCFMQLVRLLCGACPLWLPLRESSHLGGNDVGGVPPRPMVLWSGWFVLAMMFLCLSQELSQRRDVQIAKPSPRQSGCDFLEQPGVAVRVAERSKRKVAAVPGVRPIDPTVPFGTELSTRFRSMEHFTDLDTAGNERCASSFNIGNDQVETLGRARRGRR